jgi:hypothetical protein
LLSLVVVALVASCCVAVGSGSAAESARGCTPPSKYSRAPHRPFTVSDADVYRESCEVARLYGAKKLGRAYGARGGSRAAACAAYVTTSYQASLRRPATNGCLKGLALRAS